MLGQGEPGTSDTAEDGELVQATLEGSVSKSSTWGWEYDSASKRICSTSLMT